jgi:(p)ppGpp synthase/HD superfamily hydrolase
MEVRAIKLALQLHEGQKRKDGSPYILHPLRVMFAFRDDTGREGIVLRTAAVLHDVVEDCGVTVASIAANFGTEVADIVDHVSRRKGEIYADFIVRAGSHDLARRVKIADTEDNLRDVDLLPDETERKGLRRRYEWTLGVLR